ncbi:hypothetical protein B0H13DRAFT_2268879 [Mycena leptocephala]|nr:hypothetical protein B0H13DRAFT_2268879 [Mycena leptocephala]
MNYSMWQQFNATAIINCSSSQTTMAGEKNRAGRKASTLATNHFTQLDKKHDRTNRYYWKCKYCGDAPNSLGASIECRDNNLPNHLANSRKCPHAPSTARNEALRFMADKKKIHSSCRAAKWWLCAKF